MWNKIETGRWEYWRGDRLVGGFFSIGDGVWECWTETRRFWCFGAMTTISSLMKEVQCSL